MPPSTMPSLVTHFLDVKDPRDGPALLHPLVNIIAIAICGVICGADDWTEVEEFGHAKYDWLKRFLDLTHGAWMRSSSRKFLCPGCRRLPRRLKAKRRMAGWDEKYLFKVLST